MASPAVPNVLPKPSSTSAGGPGNSSVSSSDNDMDGQAQGGRKALTQLSQTAMQLPSGSGLTKPAGQLLRGATDDKGNQKAAALLVGVKLDLEAEVHLTARVKGDICVGLY